MIFLMDYLTFFNVEGLKAKINNNQGGLDQLKYDMSKVIGADLCATKRLIEKLLQYYVTNEILFHTDDNHPTKSELAMLTNNLDAIGRLIKNCWKHQILN